MRRAMGKGGSLSRNFDSLDRQPGGSIFSASHLRFHSFSPAAVSIGHSITRLQSLHYYCTMPQLPQTLTRLFFGRAIS